MTRRVSIAAFVCAVLVGCTKTDETARVPTNAPAPVAAAPEPAQVVKNWNFSMQKDNRVQGRFHGATARVVGPRVFDVASMKAETLRADGEVDIVAEAPECRVTVTTNGFVATSPGALVLNEADERFGLTGEGFLWDHGAQRLIVSNNVDSFLKIALPRPTPAGVPLNRFPMPTKHLPLALLASALAATTVAADEAKVPIHSRWVDFDYRNGVTHYSGAVTVDIPGLMKLACDDLVAVQAAGTNRLESLTATTNVVLDIVRPGKTPADAPMQIRAKGDVAVYTATNNLVTLTGPFGNQPHVDTAQFRTRADLITYDLATGRVNALSNHVTEVNPEVFKKSGLFNRTNKPAKTESP